MTAAPRYYAQRRLSPFTGVVEVVETADARALSPDGIRWEIQVLAEQPEHTWRTENRLSHVQSFFRFGSWRLDSGLRQVPVSPILDLDAMWGATERLLALLPGALQALPFPLRDRYEWWLLDAGRRPAVLAASTTEARFVPAFKPQPWRATTLTDHGFVSPALLVRGIPAHDGFDPRRHAGELERLVRQATGGTARGRWFLRQADDSGTPLDPAHGTAGDAPPLPAGAFPPTPLREDWGEPDADDLVGDYLRWLAPWLLTLPQLPDPLRERMEEAARSRALAVEAQYLLYPKVIRPDLIRTARVEAKIRQAGGTAG